MLDRDLTAQLLPTAFVSSFVGRARPGLELTDADPQRRAAAWGRWAIESFAEFRGIQDRAYVALVLPGRYHDPKGTGPQVRPHLEVPEWMFERADPQFPDRLAQMGNGLLFPWWLMTEVVAVRRALFNGPRGDIGDLLHALDERRVGLVDAVRNLSCTASASWDVFEQLLLASDDGLVADATGNFTTDEIAALFPPAGKLGLSVTFDEKLLERNGIKAARRVGVWRIHIKDRGGLGVVTPRLTANSLFADPLFRPENESAAALLVRALILSRLVRHHLDAAVPAAVPAAPSVNPSGGPFLRAVPARVGARLPEASMASAVNWLQTYTSAREAWEVLSRWAAGGGYLLTVIKDGFEASYANAQKFLRRAEDPEREDINVILPLAWDTDGKVVRVTFSRPTDDL